VRKTAKSSPTVKSFLRTSGADPKGSASRRRASRRAGGSSGARGRLGGPRGRLGGGNARRWLVGSAGSCSTARSTRHGKLADVLVFLERYDV